MPTYGRVSRYGLIAFASSLDHIGPLTRTVEDAAIMLSVIAGHDPMDSTSAKVSVPDYVAEIGKPVRGMKLGVPERVFRRRAWMRKCAQPWKMPFSNLHRKARRSFLFRCRILHTPCLLIM